MCVCAARYKQDAIPTSETHGNKARWNRVRMIISAHNEVGTLCACHTCALPLSRGAFAALLSLHVLLYLRRSLPGASSHVFCAV
jgi:hypothetical protein